jgi:hypothetical protein
MKTKSTQSFFCFCILHSAFCLSAFAQGTAFTYQGRLNASGAPANGAYDLQFILFNVNQFGFPVGPVLTNANVSVNNGLFAASLDFGSGVFMGINYWLEISVRTNGGGAFTTLVPRQPVTPTPYAVFAENVGSGGIAGGIYPNAVTFNNAANSFNGSFTGNGTGVTNVNAVTLGGLGLSNFWKLGGNTDANPANGNFIGTTDDQPFEIRVNNIRAMRYRVVAGTQVTNAPNVIGGSANNFVSSTTVGATIGGGGGTESFDGTEYVNKVTADFGTVGGGLDNTASGLVASTVSGGRVNTASSYDATVSGGRVNTASGPGATVPGGMLNTASGGYSFAAGRRAKADDDGSFVWADSSDFDFHSALINQFAVRCTGGAKFVTAIDGTGAQTAGVRLQAGDTAWSSISDRNAKKNFQPVNAEVVLEKLAALPVQSWNYKWESDTNTPHLGPMAQDFKAAFYPGRDDKSISTLEFDGVELAAIQGLNQKLTEKLEQKETEITELKQRLEALEKIILDRKPD